MNLEINENLNLSKRRTRIVAFIIDHFSLTFLLVSTVFMILGPRYMDENNSEKMTTIMLAVMLPGFLLYFAKDSLRGMSLGKWIMGIMIRDKKNSIDVPSFGRLLIRNLFIIIWPIEFIVLALNQDKQRLGDKIAKTIVVENPDKASRLSRALAFSGIGVAFSLFLFLFVTASLKSSDAYIVAIKEIEINKDILVETGGIKGYGFVPGGSINVSNGNGQAQLKIKVLGNAKDISVNVHLIKENDGEWKLTELSK